jgi:hypothetical protein
MMSQDRPSQPSLFYSKSRELLLAHEILATTLAHMITCFADSGEKEAQHVHDSLLEAADLLRKLRAEICPPRKPHCLPESLELPRRPTGDLYWYGQLQTALAAACEHLVILYRYLEDLQEEVESVQEKEVIDQAQLAAGNAYHRTRRACEEATGECTDLEQQPGQDRPASEPTSAAKATADLGPARTSVVMLYERCTLACSRSQDCAVAQSNRSNEMGLFTPEFDIQIRRRVVADNQHLRSRAVEHGAIKCLSWKAPEQDQGECESKRETE